MITDRIGRHEVLFPEAALTLSKGRSLLALAPAKGNTICGNETGLFGFWQYIMLTKKRCYFEVGGRRP